MPKSAMLPVLPGIKIVSKTLADGTVKTFYYHRATKLALGSDRARAVARAAEIEMLAGPEPRRRQAGALSDVIAKFKVSPEYVGLAEGTKTLWLPFLTDLEERVGDWAPKMFSRAMASKFKATLIAKHGSGSARNRFKCYSRLWNWAVQNGHIEVVNPFTAPGSFGKGRHSKKAKPIWRLNHVEAFLTATRQVDVGGNPALVTKKATRTEGVPNDMRLAFLLALFTLQRRGDILKITGDKLRADNHGRWWLKLKQEKTGADVEFPVHKLLRAEIERQKITPGEKRPLVQTKTEGMFDDRNFSRKFRTWLEAANIRSLNFHALRRSGMVWLAEAGVSAPRIAGLSGHSIAVTQKILDEYIVRTKELAEGAVDAFERITQDAFPVLGGHS
jgi:integrase